MNTLPVSVPSEKKVVNSECAKLSLQILGKIMRFKLKLLCFAFDLVS